MPLKNSVTAEFFDLGDAKPFNLRKFANIHFSRIFASRNLDTYGRRL